MPDSNDSLYWPWVEDPVVLERGKEFSNKWERLRLWSDIFKHYMYLIFSNRTSAFVKESLFL